MVGQGIPVLWGLEPQQPGGQEVPTSVRLLRRTHADHHHFADVIALDASYTQGPAIRATRWLGRRPVIQPRDERYDVAPSGRRQASLLTVRHEFLLVASSSMWRAVEDSPYSGDEATEGEPPSLSAPCILAAPGSRADGQVLRQRPGGLHAVRYRPP